MGQPDTRVAWEVGKDRRKNPALSGFRPSSGRPPHFPQSQPRLHGPCCRSSPGSARAAEGPGLLPTIPLAPACPGPFLALPSSLSLFTLFIRALTVISFSGHPLSNQPSVLPTSSLALSLLYSSSRHFSPSALTLLVYCSMHCLPYQKVSCSSAGTVSCLPPSPIAKSIAWHMWELNKYWMNE